jgi:hypothetical protein
MQREAHHFGFVRCVCECERERERGVSSRRGNESRVGIRVFVLKVFL